MNDRKFWKFLQGKPEPPEQEHRERLERRLLAAYNRQTTRAEPRRVSWFRHAPAIALMLALLTASQVPASYRVALGKRITVEFSASSPPEGSAKALVKTLNLSAEDHTSVDVQLHMKTGETSVLIVNAWGDQLPIDSAIVARLRAVAEFADAKISVTRLEGKIRDNVGGLLRHLFFHSTSTPEERERARQELIEELRQTEGSDASIDVQLEDQDGRQEVRVKVLRPPPEEPAQPK